MSAELDYFLHHCPGCDQWKKLPPAVIKAEQVRDLLEKKGKSEVEGGEVF